MIKVQVMEKKIALVNFCFPPLDPMQLGVPQASLALATFLRLNTEIEPKIYDIARHLSLEQMNVEALSNQLSSIPERIIGVSVWDSVLPKVVLATKYLKELDRERIIMIGGPSASSVGERIIENFPWIDFVVKGEGERSLTNVLDWISSSNADPNKLSSNVIGKWKSENIKGRVVTPRLKNEDIPSLDYSGVDYVGYRKFELSTSRGCPYSCDFCSANNVWEGTIRFKEAKNIRREIDFISGIARQNVLHILDDNFGVNRRHFDRVCAMLHNEFPDMKWTSYFRIDDLTPEATERLTSSGCIGVFIGLETGSNEKRNSWGKLVPKNVILSRLKQAADYLHVTASFIWGHPDESETELCETLELIGELLPANNIFVNLYQLAPLSGTKVQEQLRQKMVFDPSSVSGLIYPEFYPRLSEEEQELIKSSPEMFSAFYRHDAAIFPKKQSIVNDFLDYDTDHVQGGNDHESQ